MRRRAAREHPSRAAARGAVPAAAVSLAAALALSACRGEPRPTAVAPPRPATSRTTTSANLARIDLAIRRFAGDHAGRLPEALNDLAREDAALGGRYLREVPLDPWGRPYSYAVTDPRLGAYDLRSYGPDTLPGTEDDLVAPGGPVPVGTSDPR